MKFQLFKAELLYPANCGVVDTPVGPLDFYKVLQHLTLPPEWIAELKAYTERRGLMFLCTPFDEEATHLLASLNVQAFKIASSELNHLPLLRVVAQHQKPLICSTGLSTMGDIEEALQAIRQAWPEAAVVLLQCASAYPLPPAQANLAVIRTLREAFGIPIGYSDHTADPEVVPAVAVAAGACLIEKHYTLNRSLPGPDHAFALEPDELATMVQTIREVEGRDPAERLASLSKRFGEERVKVLLGHGRKEIMPAERALYPNDKRSIHAVRDISAGEILTAENLRILRSERNLHPGLHPRYWETILGARLMQDVPLGKGIRWEDILAK